MIVFDLACGQGHVFEAWFGSSEDYEQQCARGLVSCPVCNTGEISKAVMAPRVGRKGNQLSTASSVPTEGTEPAKADDVQALMQRLAEAQREILKGSEWVGTRFADEARAIHLGEREATSIHGQATPDEARALIEEGVPVAPLPFPVRPPNSEN